MVASSPRFPDIQTHWARPFIEALAQRGIVRGFEDQTFRPNRAVSRAEFAALLQTAFPRSGTRPYTPFTDVPPTHWAAGAIRWAFETGFLSGYPGRQFRPNESIPRVQALASLAGGLSLTSASQVPLAQLYQDANQIPKWAMGAIAAATAAGIVVNYPSLQQLKPVQAATRAEVAVFIYQCLVDLGQAPTIASDYLVKWVQTVTVSHRREFRAVWVATVWNGDFPSKQGLTTEQQQAELIAILNRMQSMNLNALILQVRPAGDALYASQLEPWTHWLSGTQGKAPEPFYDPLEFAIAQCHQRNIELHAWFNPYRASASTRTTNVRPHIAVTNPEVVYTWGNQLWMDPGAKVVQERALNVILDVLRRYDVDGIHLDDYFYPYPIAGKAFPDDQTYAAYRANGGNLSLGDWRRENVNQLIQRLATRIRAEKPHVKFGISPFGIYRPGQPEQIRGLDAYDQLYADSLKWLQQGWVDYLAPQLYWRIDPPAQSYPVLLKWWVENNSKQRYIYPGNNLGQLDGRTWDLAEIERQIDITRNLKSQLALGNIFFSMSAFTENRQGITDRFQIATYRTPALVPVMSWLQTSPPAPPQRVQMRNGKLTWQPASSNIRSWALYRQDASQWTLLQVLPASATAITVGAGTYAVSAVDRLSQESQGIVIST